ncbi:helix-turn-helix transcriptional regulator [Listeria monocytogenes]|uniref:helix-turn-helix transcriptional regulator n=1 Tax=Listeria monocytogenes TaxID=1639 RepID=UPI0008755683|nr:helix-turn-helix transcriptional regulator [Listeria monocytogenes]EKO3230152.1 helix-turn-helix transcriptional regulator [Listeria innocua]EAC4797929.1 XRE family transcriptional regulator [Listeria monocytogenes]EAC4995047.1 XRE family transcriptional regulator [Listeria monocytogenes]EAC6723858.1 XRE family transcriptional regulator [Listeria monocytogenes]EAC7100633.1 XRE family transcriptional regulator [Listeria monocytogenes]
MKSWLKELREQKAYTQEEVAKKAGVERTTYASIEQGRRNPSVSKAIRIASVLDFDWTIFFDEKLRESTHKKLTKIGG